MWKWFLRRVGDKEMETVSSSLCQNMTACVVPLQMWQRKLPLHSQPPACSHHSALKWERHCSQNSFHYPTFSFQLGFVHLADSKPFCRALILDWEYYRCSIFGQVEHYRYGVLPLGKFKSGVFTSCADLDNATKQWRVLQQPLNFQTCLLKCLTCRTRLFFSGPSFSLPHSFTVFRVCCLKRSVLKSLTFF